MKQVLVFVCFFFIANSVYAQDAAQIDSSGNVSSFQPFAGLGVLNGGRFGVAMKINDVITVEAGLGIDLGGTIGILTTLLFIPVPSTIGGAFSQGIILTPFSDVRRLSFILYNTYTFRSSQTLSAVQMMAGWKLFDGETSDFRISVGHAVSYAGDSKSYRKLLYAVDIVLTF